MGKIVRDTFAVVGTAVACVAVGMLIVFAGLSLISEAVGCK